MSYSQIRLPLGGAGEEKEGRESGAQEPEDLKNVEHDPEQCEDEHGDCLGRRLWAGVPG